MRLEDLKKGFWGYQKEAVLQYIAAQEEACSLRLLEKDEQATQASLKAQARIQELEAEVQRLRQELGELRRMRDQIPQVMLDARASAQALQDQMNAQAQVAGDNLRQALDADLAQLARYREQIQALRQSLQEALEGMDRQAQQLQQQAQALEEESPEKDLQLFA